MSRNKKTLIILGVIVVIILVGILLYYLFFRQSGGAVTPAGQTGSLPNVPAQGTSGNQTGNTGGTSGSSPSGTTNSSQTFGVLGDEQAMDYYVDSGNNTTLIQPDGTILTLTNGQPVILSSSKIQDIIGASFSYDGKKILVNFGDGADPQTSVFDLASKAWTPLPQGMQSPAWSPSSYQVAYLTSGASGSGKENIVILNSVAPGAAPSVLATVAMEDMLLRWPNKGTLILSDKPDAYIVGSAWAFNISNKTIISVDFQDLALQSIWSNATSGLGLIFRGTTGYVGGDISLLNFSGSQTVLTFVTLPSKCAFNEDVVALPQGASTTAATSTTAKATTTAMAATTTTLDLYCAVPRDQQTLTIARLPDEYNQKIILTADDFYKVNTNDGTLSVVFSDQSYNLDATDLKIFNNRLFFINRYDQRLYGVALP